MSDSRFHCKIEFSIYGKDFKWDSSLNWSADSGAIDQRIADWFIACHEEAYADYTESTRRYFEREAKKQAEIEERALLAQLKAKYEGQP